MAAGFAAAVPAARAALAERPDDVGELLRRLGHTLVGSVGGASGPLYGTAFIEAGFALAGRAGGGTGRPGDGARGGPRRADPAGPLRGGRQDDPRRPGPRGPGPPRRRRRVEPPRRLRRRRRRRGRRRGMRATIPLVARRGLALRLGERSRGHRDPGATSCFLLLQAMARAVGDRSAPVSAGRPTERIAALEARVRELETERRRVFEDAQREADAVFAQYQLSQLLAAGGRVDEIAAAVLAEVARAAGAGGAALWLGEPGEPLARARRHVPGRSGRPGRARLGRRAAPLRGRRRRRRGGRRPAAGAGSPSRRAGPWAAAIRGGGTAARSATWRSAPTPASPWSRTTPGTSRRCASSSRSRCGRRSCARRSRASRRRSRAILEGATDAIVAVDAGRRVVRLNAAAAALVGTPARAGTGMRCSEFLGCAAPSPDAAQRARRAAPAGRRGPAVRGALPVRGGPGDGAPDRRPRDRRPPPRRDRDPGRRQRLAHAGARRRGRRRPARPARRPGPSTRRRPASWPPSRTSCGRPLALIDGYTQSLLHLDLDAATARRHLERIAGADGAPQGPRRRHHRRRASWRTTRSPSAARPSPSTASCAPSWRSGRRRSARARSSLVLARGPAPGRRRRHARPAGAREPRPERGEARRASGPDRGPRAPPRPRRPSS